MRKGSFKNNSQKPKLHPKGIYKYKEKTTVGISDCFFFGSVVNSWLSTSKHTIQEELNILQWVTAWQSRNTLFRNLTPRNRSRNL